MAFIDSIRTKRNKELEATCERPGYYLVKGGERHFISETVSEPALNRVCNRVLSEKKGWDYWVDYSFGRDVHGNVAWANLDQTARFI